MRTWTDREVSILLENYNKVSNSVLISMIPEKSKQGIYKKAYKLGLRKDKNIEFINRSEARRRENASNWKGGVKYTAKGYRQVLVPEHLRADAGGYVMEHIYVWEKETGVPVPSGCCVHHLNGDKTDNRIENLCLMSVGAHTVFHHTGTHHSEEKKKKIRRKRLKHAE